MQIKMEHTYILKTFANNKDVPQNKHDEVDIASSSGDSLLIDLVRNYPHLYDKSSSNFKDSIMKENSWNEIGKIMKCPPIECQTRWIRLRERFSKERREMELECKSGSGISHRKTFSFYENMKFLEKHVRRRRCYSNIQNQNETNKENILNSPNNVLLYGSGNHSTTTSTSSVFHNFPFSSVKPSIVPTNISCQLDENIESTTRILDTSRETEDNVVPTKSLDHTSVTHSTPDKPERCSSTSSISSHNSMHTSPASQYDKCFIPTAKKRPKSGSDEVEQSLLTLSSSIAERLNSSKVESKIEEMEKNVDDKFGELIAVELKKIPEQKRIEKKKRKF